MQFPAQSGVKADVNARGEVDCIVGDEAMRRVDSYDVVVMPHLLIGIAFLACFVGTGHLTGMEYTQQGLDAFGKP